MHRASTLALLLACVATSSAATRSLAAGSPELPFPQCAWWLKVGGGGAPFEENIAWPDISAAYWVT